jgi:hypothetical protein
MAGGMTLLIALGLALVTLVGIIVLIVLAALLIFGQHFFKTAHNFV